MPAIFPVVKVHVPELPTATLPAALPEVRSKIETTLFASAVPPKVTVSPPMTPERVAVPLRVAFVVRS